MYQLTVILKSWLADISVWQFILFDWGAINKNYLQTLDVYATSIRYLYNGYCSYSAIYLVLTDLYSIFFRIFHGNFMMIGVEVMISQLSWEFCMSKDLKNHARFKFLPAFFGHYMNNYVGKNWKQIFENISDLVLKFLNFHIYSKNVVCTTHFWNKVFLK